MTKELITQPTDAMIEAGIEELCNMAPGMVDQLYENGSDEEGVTDFLSDTVVFVWQAMLSASNK